MKPADLVVLRDLARRVAEVAALPGQAETVRLWKALNALRPERPMVMIDQVPWHEMDEDGELTLRTADPFARELETGLRRTLYQWAHMRADMVVLPVVEVRKVIRSTGFGIEAVEDVRVTDTHDAFVGHSLTDQLQTAEDAARIRTPEVRLDEAATAERESAAHEAFDGILGVRMQGLLPWYALWDEIVELRTPETALIDLKGRADFMHDVADRWSRAHLAWLDELEGKGLLGHAQTTILCTGAFTDELPAPGFDPARPRAKDLWTYGMAQVCGSVSTPMFEEFELPHAIRWFERFGLGYYGCCEPLHHRIDLVRRIPNVRKISISQWAKVDPAADAIGPDYVMSRKIDPVPLALDDWSMEPNEADIRASIAACRRTGTPLELSLKDISTVRGRPQRLWAWERRAMELVRSA